MPSLLLKNRFDYIDIAKTIGIVLVVVGHYCPAGSPNWWVTMKQIIYTFHMPLFFFASGMVYQLTQTERTYSEAIAKKAKRLLVPYFSISIVFLSIKLILSTRMPNNDATFRSFLHMFYYPAADLSLWFIFVLFSIFLIVPLLNNEPFQWGTLVVSAIIAIAPNQITELFCLHLLPKHLAFFLLGALLSKRTNFSLPYWQIGGLCVCFILGIMVYLEQYDQSGWLKQGVSMTCGVSAIYIVLALSQRLNATRFGTRVLQLSPYTFTIYLFHPIFQGGLKLITNKMVGNSTEFFFVLSALFIIGCGNLLPVLLHRFVLSKTTITSFLFAIPQRK